MQVTVILWIKASFQQSFYVDTEEEFSISNSLNVRMWEVIGLVFKVLQYRSTRVAGKH